MSRCNDSVSGKDRRVGLIFDERMCKHYSPHEKDHVECPDRIRVIWDLLRSSGLAKRCIILKAKDAQDNHLALVHTTKHISLIKSISSGNSQSKRKRIAGKFDSIYFNEGSTEAACIAAGSVIEAAEKVAKGEIDSAFAIVRPPGHHAEEGEPMGFCLYNNVAIASSYLLNERRELEINKILIVDWDVHHGNGTQKMFYKDPRVLVFSVHRYDSGTFYPTGHDGSYIMTGEGPGAGHNINVPWEQGQCGDADYLAVWEHILIPVAKAFDPDMIIISAGFDAAIGDPLGECCVSPNGYSIMLKKLMEFAGGKIVMALEGGYNLNSTACSTRACVEVLLRDKPSNVVPEARPFASTWRVIQEVCRELSTYWPVLALSESDPATCPQVLKKGPQKKRHSDAQGPSSEPTANKSWHSLSPVIQKGSDKEKSKKKSDGSQIKIQLSGNVTKLTPAECSALLRAIPNSEGVTMPLELGAEQLMDGMSFSLVEHMILHSEMMKSVEEKDAALKELESKLKEKDAELMKATADLNKATELIAKFEAENQKQIAKLEAENQKQIAKLEAENRELRQRLADMARSWSNAEKEKELLLTNARHNERKARAEAREAGIKFYRERVLMTSAGQGFLKELHEGLIAAYLQSAQYLHDVGKCIRHYVEAGVRGACEHLGVADRIGKVDVNEIVGSLSTYTPPGFTGDENLPLDHPWWLPVMREAVTELANESPFDPEMPPAEHIIYDVLPVPSALPKQRRRRREAHK